MEIGEAITEPRPAAIRIDDKTGVAVLSTAAAYLEARGRAPALPPAAQAVHAFSAARKRLLERHDLSKGDGK